MTRRRSRGVAALLLSVAAMTSCSATTTTHTAPHNDADVMFARMMIPHHQQAVVLAAMVPTNTSNPDLQVMATHIGAAQKAEVGVLQDLLAEWGEQASDPHADHHGGMQMMTGMVDQATLDRLPTLYDSAFDTLWTTSMIGHHEGAVSMAQDEIAQGESPDAKHVAQLIIESQQREIALMKHLISATE
jgi:uncharacterized protein (DUF305 family)